MGTAYTPGLAVNAHTKIIKTRRLPLKGSVLVERGARVGPDTTVARADLPGIMQTMKVSASMGIDAGEVPGIMLVGVGDAVTKGQIVARTKGMWGLFKAEYKATATGIVELISPVSGNVGVREAPTPVEIAAYIPGIVTDVLPGEGVVIEATGAFIQGIFGIGGERRAPLKVVSPSPDTPLTESDITPDLAGKVILGGSNISGAALQKCADTGVVGIIVGGIVDKDLVAYLGYDIGVAITGHENIPLSLVITEGFGTIAMAQRTFDLLARLEGREASICGATQIRAGVIRPEVIVADTGDTSSATATDESAYDLAVGASIRIIREPYFGKLATVTGLPPHLTRIGSGAEVRVLDATLAGGEKVTVPRANVEIVISG